MIKILKIRKIPKIRKALLLEKAGELLIGATLRLLGRCFGEIDQNNGRCTVAYAEKYKKEDEFWMIIKACNEEDIVAVGAFYDHVVEHLCQNINYPKWTYKEYPSEASVRIKTEAGQQFICVENGVIVGAFVLNDDPQGKYENAVWNIALAEGDYMVCHTLATDPSRRGRGIGMQIVAYCIEYAKEHRFKAIRLDVVPDNLPAKRLYEKCGFQYVGDVDLERDIDEIPVFSMYELNFL